MRKIIKGWKHIPGLHCGSTSLMDVANYYKYPFTEELCFGLGGGLGFYYTVDNEMSPTHAIHVRGPGMEANFVSLFGKDIEDWKYEPDSNKAFNTLKQFIDRDIPVLIQTDIYYLDYYNSSTHFPGHIIVVNGYDDEKGEFYVSDTGFEGYRNVSYEEMTRARVSKAKPYPLENNWFETDIGGSEFNMASSAGKAILRNAREMLHGVNSIRGESGVSRIKSWSDDVLNWASLHDWNWCSRYSYQVISKRGTEGAAFRHMYRDFLKEVSVVLPVLKGSGLIEMMDDIGDVWVNVSDRFKYISELESPGDEFNSARSDIHQLYEYEKEFYKKVLTVFDL